MLEGGLGCEKIDHDELWSHRCCLCPAKSADFDHLLLAIYDSTTERTFPNFGNRISADQTLKKASSNLHCSNLPAKRLAYLEMSRFG